MTNNKIGAKYHLPNKNPQLFGLLSAVVRDSFSGVCINYVKGDVNLKTPWAFYFTFFERDPDSRYVYLTTIVNNGLLLLNNNTIHIQNIMGKHIENSSVKFVSVTIIYTFMYNT